MAARTIPEPTAVDFNVAFGAVLMTAQSHGLNVSTDEAVLATLRDIAEVHAQMAAEIRWRCNMSHPSTSAPSDDPGGCWLWWWL